MKVFWISVSEEVISIGAKTNKTNFNFFTYFNCVVYWRQQEGEQ